MARNLTTTLRVGPADIGDFYTVLRRAGVTDTGAWKEGTDTTGGAGWHVEVTFPNARSMVEPKLRFG